MSNVVGLVLAGGEGRRLGCVNKGLVGLAGRPLIDYVSERLRSQVQRIYISANQDIDAYKNYCDIVIEDDCQFKNHGPLAGMFSLANHIDSGDIVQVVTCDAPFLPYDLVAKQRAFMEDKKLDAVYPMDENRQHYGFLMVKGKFLLEIKDLLLNKKLRIRNFISLLNTRPLLFKESSGFMNINDEKMLNEIERFLDKGF